jgi:hypothetical protein
MNGDVMMFRKTAIKRREGKQQNHRATKARRAKLSVTDNALALASDHPTTEQKAAARLKSAAKEAFRLMGED